MYIPFCRFIIVYNLSLIWRFNFVPEEEGTRNASGICIIMWGFRCCWGLIIDQRTMIWYWDHCKYSNERKFVMLDTQTICFNVVIIKHSCYCIYLYVFVLVSSITYYNIFWIYILQSQVTFICCKTFYVSTFAANPTSSLYWSCLCQSECCCTRNCRRLKPSQIEVLALVIYKKTAFNA